MPILVKPKIEGITIFIEARLFNQNNHLGYLVKVKIIGVTQPFQKRLDKKKRAVKLSNLFDLLLAVNDD